VCGGSIADISKFRFAARTRNLRSLMASCIALPLAAPSFRRFSRDIGEPICFCAANSICQVIPRRRGVEAALADIRERAACGFRPTSGGSLIVKV
jgi:hypothetical protein